MLVAPARASRLVSLLVLVVLIVPAAAAAAADDKVLTPMEVALVRSIGEATISPDGSFVAYTEVVPRDLTKDDNGGAWTRLYVVPFEGGEPRLYVGGEVNVGHVRWSPDGLYLTYLARRESDNATAVWRIPLSGGESEPLVRHETSVSTFEWNADGTALAFIASRPRDGERDALRTKGFNQEIYEEDFTARQLLVNAIDGAIAGETKVLEQLDGHPYNVVWSPDGNSVLTDPAPTPLVDDRYMSRRLKIADAGSGAVMGAIDNPGKLGAFAFAPDGDTIAMVSAADINDPMEGRLMTISPAGERMQDLLPGLAGHVEQFAFIGDGQLLYVASIGVGSRLGRVAMDGSSNEVLLEGDDVVINSLSVDGSGNRLAMVMQSSSVPRELYALDIAAGGEPTRLTESNPWLADFTVAAQEVVRWTARDGLEIEGLLIHPLERAEGERVPLIVVAHGGPESHYDNGWLTAYSMPGQMAAARGYAVFYPNYRGSTGRGVDFAKADQHDGMGGEFEDILDGIDYLIERGLVDADRVGITGGSYGGYTTAWASTRYSERFAAGVMFVGISNQLSKTGTSDIPREMELVHWLSNPYKEPELFLERSPVMYTANAQTPLLILHGKDDPRVNPGQSYELYRALKMQTEVPVRLVLYPGEGHGNRRAAARYDYNLRMLRWFDHFLMNGNTEMPDWRLEYGLDS